MPSAERAALHFVRALLPGGEARCGADGVFRIANGRKAAALPVPSVAALISTGALIGDARACRASPEAANWLKRRLAGGDGQLAQHRQEVRRADGSVINLAESPLARLAVAAAGESVPFLEPHQVEAGERFRRLVERAQLRTRVTMSYDGSPTARGSGSGAADGISDMAADARRAVARLAEFLPRDCADILLEVCGFLKGLQQIESERGWPRRSAKLVLRIGLDQLARHWGLSSVATAPAHARTRSWIAGGQRPAFFANAASDQPAMSDNEP